MISIVIPLYNKKELIVKTVQSILNQTYHNFEIIIVDDGSTDGSADEVKTIKDSRIRLISQKNSGVASARNRGIKESQGDFVAFIDADDLWSPDYLYTLISLTQNYPNCNVFASNYKFRNIEGAITYPKLKSIPFTGEHGILNNYFEVSSVSDPPLWTSAVMIRKSAIESVNGFPIGIKSGEDLLTWARLACRYHIAYNLKTLAIYCQGYSNPRPPESKDYVGEQLERLFKDYPATQGIKRYIAFWYKMRMCRCLAYRMWGKSLKALNKSLAYNPLQWKIYFSIIKYTLIGVK